MRGGFPGYKVFKKKLLVISMSELMILLFGYLSVKKNFRITDILFSIQLFY